MHHIAIMNKKWKLIDKILSGDKKIESRWYMTRRDPWLKIQTGDTVFFKNSGEPVTAVADVERVLFFGPEQDLINKISKFDAKGILQKYGKDICIADLEDSLKQVANKKYCILVYLENPRKVGKVFSINKKGFGISSAWLCVDNVREITA